MSNGTRRSVQQMLSDLYRGFNQNRAVFPRRGRTMPRSSGIGTIPFDVGSEADNARRGGMSEYQIQAMLARAKRPGLPISPTVLASVQKPMVEKSNNVNAPRGIDSLSRKQQSRRRMLNEGFLIPQGSVPGKDGRRVRVGLPNVLYPDQPVPSGPNTLGPATADYLGLRLINPASAEYGAMSNLSPAEATAMRMRNEYGTSDPTPTIPAVEDEERLARDVNLVTTDMPGGRASVTPTEDIGSMISKERVAAGSDPEIMPRPSDSRRQGTVPLPKPRPSNTRPPDAVGPPVPAVEPIRRPMPKPQMDAGKDAELDAGIDQKVDAEKDDSFKFDPNMDLVSLGLEISAAASKPGATFLGSLAQGGLNHLNKKEKRELVKEDREYKRSIMKMEQKFRQSEKQLDRAQELNIAQGRIGILEETNKIRAESLAETIRKNSEMLKIEFKKLKTEDQKAAEGKLMAAKIKVMDAQALNYEAQASGEKDKIRLSDAKTEREYVRAIIDIIDVDKLDVLGKTEAEKNAVYTAEVNRALSMVGVIRTGLEKFLPGVTAAVRQKLEGGGGGVDTDPKPKPRNVFEDLTQ